MDTMTARENLSGAQGVPVISVVGKSDAGKTTLLEKLIPELKRRGYRVGTIKHDVHGFEVDHPGKDTWRHAQAGSDHVIIASAQKLASIRRLDHELTLDEIVAEMTDVDIVLTEGYKRAGKLKIEVSRAARSTELICHPGELLAVATDHPVEIDVPQFDLDDAKGIVDLIERRFLRPQGTTHPLPLDLSPAVSTDLIRVDQRALD